MGGKKLIIMITILAMLFGGAAIGYSWQQNSANVSSFDSSGYILTADADSTDKKLLFSAGTVFKEGIASLIAFDDVQGETKKVEKNSFVHYDNDAISSLDQGVVVDLNDVSTSQMTNHYAVAPSLVFEAQGDSYVLANAQSDITFTDLLWKLDETKYMLVSTDMQIHFSSEDVRDAGDFIEVSFIDEGVIQLQTEDNLWQTASTECFTTLANGDVVDFSMRNIQTVDGDVIMDFSKIVVGADDNIELIPLTEELENVAESVIPHFEITATNGADGADGTVGTTGESGTSGDDGTSGGNGSAGTSGTSGSAGSSGSSGSDGSTGGSVESEDNVLVFPEFTVENWVISPTGCSGTITATDDGDMLQMNDSSTNMVATMYLVDVDTSEVIDITLGYTLAFNPLSATGYDFEVTGLDPDHSYRLVVSAPINTGEGYATYMRDFVNKTFWTDSVGVYIETSDVSKSTAVIEVVQQDYADSTVTTVGAGTVYLYSTLNYAQAATSTSYTTGIVASESYSISNNLTSLTFSDLSSNTTYYARVLVSSTSGALMPSQVLTVQTLKSTASLGTPTITANRDSWGFDLTPGTVYDPDNGIVTYTYEFYYANDVSGNVLNSYATPVKTVTDTTSRSLIVPLDGVNLQSGTEYIVRTVATFYDNEKTYEIYSSWSNIASVDGSALPAVYFVNSSEASTGESITATDVSFWYDQIYGTLKVAPSTDGATVLLDWDHHPTVTIRASGYYYVQYPVYTADDPNLPSSGQYLLGEVLTGGYVDIYIPNGVFVETDGSLTIDTDGTVNGLRPDTQYRMIVSGDLSEDGTHAYETNVIVGSTTVETPDDAVISVDWTDDDDDDNDVQFSTLMVFEVYEEDEGTTAEETYNREMNNITTLKFTLTDGLESSPGNDLASFTVTDQDFKTVLADRALASELAAANSLGELLENGLTMTESFFGLKTEDFASVSSVHITVSDAYDYTYYGVNRVNQMAYVSSDSDDETAEPDSTSSDGAVYINQFSLLGAVHDIKLTPKPDDIPEYEKGITVVENYTRLSYEDIYLTEYSLTPNYLNSAELAQTITFYVFDNPVFEQDYEYEDGWAINLDYFDFEKPLSYTIPLNAVTAAKRNQIGTDDQGDAIYEYTDTQWLAMITLTVPSSGAMPSAYFIPDSLEDYYYRLYPDNTSTAKALIDAYEAGVTKNSDGEYIFFYDDYHLDEESTGHQFRFAWTMIYTTSAVDNEGVTQEDLLANYPFALTYGDLLTSIPQSPVSDYPRQEPTVYALPYSSSETESTWAVQIYDADHALSYESWIEDSDTASLPLYTLSNVVTGTALLDETTGEPITVEAEGYISHYEPSIQMDEILADSTYHVTLPAGTTGGSSTTLGATVKWYTDVYFDDNGDYKSGVAINSSMAIWQTVATTQVATLSDYETLFIYYHDPDDYTATRKTVSDTTITVSEYATTGTSDGAVSGYKVVVTKTSEEAWSTVNGYRFTFTCAGEEDIVLDKIVTGTTDEASGSGTELSFYIPLSLELGKIAGKSGVSLTITELYETGKEGFSYLEDDGQVALRSYTQYTGSGAALDTVAPTGNYQFISGGFANNSWYESGNANYFARLGSFFTASFSSGTTYSLDVTSTRYSSILSTLTYSFKNASVTNNTGFLSGGYTVAPRELTTSANINASNITISNLSGDLLIQTNFAVPKVTPIITYDATNSVAAANSVTSVFTYSTSYAVKFALYEKLTYDTGSYTWVQQGYDEETMEWEDVADTAEFETYLYDNYTVSDFGGMEITFSNLPALTEYRVVAYYYDDDDKEWKAMNMYDANNTELANYQYFVTSDEPGVYISTAYSASGYSYKRFRTYVSISKATNYYYTVELQNYGGNFITYVSMGDSSTNTNYYYHEVGNSTTDLESSTNYSRLKYCSGFDTENNTLLYEDNASNVYLTYGSYYTAVVKVYNKGEGPAYGGTVDDVLVTSESGLASSISTFKVNNTADALYAVPDFSVNTENEVSTPIITFDLTYPASSAKLLRQHAYAAVVIRARTDENGDIIYTDVSEYVTTSNGNYITDEAYDSWNKIYTSASLILDGSSAAVDLMLPGDEFTCYVYSVVDYTTSTYPSEDGDTGSEDANGDGVISRYTSTAGYFGEYPTREYILAGRTLNTTGVEGEYELSEATVKVDYGVSTLMATTSQKYSTTDVNAGTVSITTSDTSGTFDVFLESPVQVEFITHYTWSVQVEYTDTSGEVSSFSVMSGDEDNTNVPMSLSLVGSSTYKTSIEASMSSLPSGATIDRYVVSVQFYTGLDTGDDDISYTQVDIGGGATGTTLNNNQITAIFTVTGSTTSADIGEIEVEIPEIEVVPDVETDPDFVGPTQQEDEEKDDTEEVVPDTTNPDDTEEVVPDTTNPDDTEEVVPDTTNPDDTEEVVPDTTNPDDTEEVVPDTTNPDDTEEVVPDTTNPDDTEEVVPDTTNPDDAEEVVPDTTNPDNADTETDFVGPVQQKDEEDTQSDADNSTEDKAESSVESGSGEAQQTDSQEEA